jgi:hypothetical protein
MMNKTHKSNLLIFTGIFTSFEDGCHSYRLVEPVAFPSGKFKHHCVKNRYATGGYRRKILDYSAGSVLQGGTAPSG